VCWDLNQWPLAAASGHHTLVTCALNVFFFVFPFFLQIIENDCAYVVDGDVYYSVDSFPAYGRLSGRNLEDNRAGERVAVDARKRNPADFALWKVRILVFSSSILYIQNSPFCLFYG
jgi:cysteinyl-tRNA synthetase